MIAIDFAKVEAFRDALLAAITWEFVCNEPTRKRAIEDARIPYAPAEIPSLDSLSAIEELDQQWWELTCAPYALLNCNPHTYFVDFVRLREAGKSGPVNHYSMYYARCKLRECNTHPTSVADQKAILRAEFDRHALLRTRYWIEDSTRLKDIRLQVKRRAQEVIDLQEGVYELRACYDNLLCDFSAQVDKVNIELGAYVSKNPHVIKSGDNSRGVGKVDYISVPHVMEWAIEKLYSAPAMRDAYELLNGKQDAQIEASPSRTGRTMTKEDALKLKEKYKAQGFRDYARRAASEAGVSEGRLRQFKTDLETKRGKKSKWD